jgi:hypothetical protein
MSWNPTQRHLRAGMAGVTAVFLAATVYWSSHPGPSAARIEPLPVEPIPPALDDARDLPRHTAQGSASASTVAVQEMAADAEQSTVAGYIAQKYQLLFDELRHLDAGRLAELQRALLLRERLAAELGTAGQAMQSAAGEELSAQETALAKVEGQIRAMLHPADFASYEMLRESDLELFRLNEYAAGIDNVAPLSEADRKSILRTKLAYKQRFRRLLDDAGLERADLSAAEREYAYLVTSRALDDFRRGYLQEVRQYLSNEEQYALLSNYEATEFKAEMGRLRATLAPLRGGS